MLISSFPKLVLEQSQRGNHGVLLSSASEKSLELHTE